MQQKQQRPTSIFSACAPIDTQWLEFWEAHLHPFEQANILSVWSVRHIQPGTDRLKLLHDHLDQADFIVLLLSVDFFTDDECFALMERALVRHQQGTVRLVPLLLRPVFWRETKLATFTALPSDGRPIILWENYEAAFDDCVRNLCLILGHPVTMPTPTQAPISTSSHTFAQRQRPALIHTLQREYSKRLVQNLQGAAMMVLDLHERIDTVRSSAQSVFRRRAVTAEYPLPSGTSIIQAYDDAGQGLLILGAPGAGKTTLLLDLARELLIRAECDSTQPIPVILNLSSWTSKKPPFATWLIDQLQLVYSVSFRLSQVWIEQNHWLLLLDGLDEVEAGARADCIEAINIYRVEHFTPLVVCSRSNEYLSEKAQLALSGAVVVQPLQEQQVIEYLKRVGKPMAVVYTALRKNPVLRQLITTPLMLSVVILAYRGKTIKDLPQLGSLEEQQEQIFESYIDSMLKQQTTKGRFTPQQTKCWLILLAQQMKQRSLTEFYLEWLQPSWLITKHVRITYRLFSCLIVGLLVGPLVGLVVGLLIGPLVGLIVGLLFGLLIGLLIGLPRDLSKEKRHEEIHPAEILQWSWKRFWQWSLVGLFIGLLGGSLGGLLVDPLVGLFFGLIVGLLGAMLFGLFGGISGMQVSKDTHTRPNQGIRHSGWNALCFGILAGLLAWLFFGLLAWLFGELFSGLLSGFLGGLLGGLMAALFGRRFFGLVGALLFGLLGALLGGIMGAQPVGLFFALFGGLLMGLLIGLLVGLPLG